MEAPREELAIVEQVTRSFYDVLPERLRTYCSAGARITQQALRRLGVESDLLPCQLMYAGPNVTYLVGFTRTSRDPGKWDGHVVCAGREWLVDAALYHLTADFGVQVPRIACQRRLWVPSQAIARCDLSETERIWWHHPPPGMDPTPPEEPVEVIRSLGDRLAAAARQRLSQLEAA